MNIIVTGICGIICCLAAIVIICIRSRHVSSGSVIEEAHSRDFIDDFLARREKRLKKNPWNMDLRTYNLIGTVCAILLSVAGYTISGKLLYGVLLAIAGFLCPELIVRLQASAQRSAFEERYARGLRQLASGLKSGLSIHQAIEDVCHSPFVHDSIRREFSQLNTDLKLGISINDAFDRFADRVRCQDAADVAIAIHLQNKVGGREAEVIESVAGNISSRLMLRKEVGSMFAGSRATILALDIIPFVIIVFLMLFAPSYMQPYFQSSAMFMALIGLIAFMGIGSLLIHSMVAKMRRECGI